VFYFFTGFFFLILWFVVILGWCFSSIYVASRIPVLVFGVGMLAFYFGPDSEFHKFRLLF
jgi:hypothetical protein